MRILEIALLSFDFIALIALSIIKLPYRALFIRLSLILPLLIILQIIIEGYRWEMVPAYILSFLLTGSILLVQFCGIKISIAWIRALLASVGFLSIIIAILLPSIFPVFTLPKPTGTNGIGTVIYDWTDNTRKELFTDTPNDNRKIVVQIWYPTDKNVIGKREPYIYNSTLLSSLAKQLKLPGFIFDHLQYVMTNSVQSAPIADSQESYPVIIFTNGLSGYRAENTLLIEQLVSHGYIIASIDQPYAYSGVLFADGQIVRFDQRMRTRSFVTGMIPFLAQDAVFTLDQLTLLNQSDPNGIFTHKLDLEKVGICGLSLGGETATEACVLDSRFKACLPMDVWMPADVLKNGLHVPTLWLTRDAATMKLEGWKQTDIDETQNTIQEAFDHLTTEGYLVKIPGMFHQDFSDAPLLSPLTSIIGITGPVDKTFARTVVSDYALAFFDHTFKGVPEILLEGDLSIDPKIIFLRK